MLLYLKRAGNTMERSLIFRGYPLQDIMPRRAENNICAGVMELADVTDSKSVDGNIVWVRVPLPAPNQYNPNQIFLIGDGFGLFVFFEKFEDTHFRNGVVKRPESRPRGPRKPKLAKDKEDNYENH